MVSDEAIESAATSSDVGCVAARGNHLQRTEVQPPPVVTTVIQPNDVLMGRGAPAVQHVGNIRFREELIAPHRKVYASTNRQQTKCDIARQILIEFEKRGGRFLCKIKSPLEARNFGVPDGTEAYAIATDDAAIEKIKQALRNKESPQHKLEAKSARVLPSSNAREPHPQVSHQNPLQQHPVVVIPRVANTSNLTYAFMTQMHARECSELALRQQQEQQRLTSFLFGQLEQQRMLLQSRSTVWNMPITLPLQHDIEIDFASSILNRSCIERCATRPMANEGVAMQHLLVDPRFVQARVPSSFSSLPVHVMGSRTATAIEDDKRRVRDPTKSRKRLKRS